MNRLNHLICIHSAIPFCILLGLGFFFIPGWFPPISPGMSAAETGAMYEANRLAIQFGMTLTVLGSGLWWVFSAAIAMQMRRIEGGDFPILTCIQLTSSVGNVIVIMLAGYFCLTAAYRPDMPASTVQSFTDIAWLMNIGAYPSTFIGTLALGLCILTGERGDVYPRWLGYLNIWYAVVSLAGGLLAFYHGGPFSWNGEIGFWLEANCFFGWIILMWWFSVRAIKTWEVA